MVQIQRKTHGGGEIYFDGKLVRKNGLFIVPELVDLNPRRLLKILALPGVKYGS
jgi:aminopeptidase